MYEERPSTRKIVVTLVGWAIALVAAFGAIFGFSYAISPKTPPISVSVVAETAAALIPSAPVDASSPVQPAAVVATMTVVQHPNRSADPLVGKVVVIDAGHQGKPDLTTEPIGPRSGVRRPKVAAGTTGYKTHTPESLVNLEVALKLRDALKARGVSVVMVRTKQGVNIANSERARIANRERAALFVRLHCDGSPDHQVAGISTLVPGANSVSNASIVTPSRSAGLLVQRAVVSATGARDHGVVDRDDLSGFGWSNVPSVLVEMGFLSNAADEARLVTTRYQQTLATGLANGIVSYLRQ